MNHMKFDNKFHEKVYKLNLFFEKIEEKLAIITLWILIIVCMIFILARFIFHVPTPWADELSRYFLILLGWMGAAYAAANNDHLSIDVIGSVVEKRAKNPEKILNVLDRISQGLSLVFLVVFLYFYAEFVIKMYKTGTPSSTLPFGMWLPMSLVLIGGFLLLVHCICYVLLPKKYWGNGNADSAKSEEQEDSE